MDSNDLTPLRNPVQELKVALENLKAEEWDKNFDAVDVVRRVMLFHADLIKDQMYLQFFLFLLTFKGKLIFI
jgi:hypothetical protein